MSAHQNPAHQGKSEVAASPPNAGPRLYLVGTPIGNLEDVTVRALRVLKQVDLIACEDTRQSQKLLNHYGISARTVSYHEHNEKERAAELVAQMETGLELALLTDAGMPGISDPGYRLVSLAIAHQIPVVPIPGPSAFVAALVASGLPTDSFSFRGFLPARSSQRRRLLQELAGSQQTEIFYEAPHRITETLQDISELLGSSRHVVLARELTKIHEEFLRGEAGQLLAAVRARELKGEITLLIAKSQGTSTESKKAGSELISVKQRLADLMSAEGIDEKTALKRVARELGISKSAAYRELQRTQA